MNFYKNIVLIFIFSLVSGLTYSQEKKSKKLIKANSEYYKFSFVKANKLYKELIDEGVVSAEVYSKLGDTYYFNSDYSEALAAYSKLVDLKVSFEPEYYYRYAQCLKTAGNYEEASKMMELYYTIIGEKDGEDLKKNISPLDEIRKQSGRYDITLQKLGSVSEFGVAFNGDKEVVYTSSGSLTNSKRKKSNWTDRPYYKLFSAKVRADGGLSNPTLLKGDVNEGIKLRYNETTPAITKDGKTMYFTRNNYYDNDIQRDKSSGINKLKIYRAHKTDDNRWANIEELPYPINSDGFSSAHPALSPDGKQLYFVSDRRNIPGDTDIYVVTVREDGAFENNLLPLSNKINTKGRETFPFVDDYGVLYFSSDGHPGLGGLDIFGAVQDKEGEYHVFNLGEPINSSSDDFSYIIDNETKKGFFASNREHELGNDDKSMKVDDRNDELLEESEKNEKFAKEKEDKRLARIKEKEDKKAARVKEKKDKIDKPLSEEGKALKTNERIGDSLLEDKKAARAKEMEDKKAARVKEKKDKIDKPLSEEGKALKTNERIGDSLLEDKKAARVKEMEDKKAARAKEMEDKKAARVKEKKDKIDKPLSEEGKASKTNEEIGDSLSEDKKAVRAKEIEDKKAARAKEMEDKIAARVKEKKDKIDKSLSEEGKASKTNEEIGDSLSEDKKAARAKEMEDKKAARAKEMEDKKAARAKEMEDKKAARVKEMEDKKAARAKEMEDKKAARAKEMEDKKAKIAEDGKGKTVRNNED